MLARFFTAILLCLSVIVNGQTPIDIGNSCTFTGEIPETETYGFDSDQEARDALQNIMKHTGLPINFKLMAGNVPNAAAVIKCNSGTGNCDRYIIYSQTFMRKVKQQTNTDWSAISILAHEIGHHLSGHTLLKGGSRPSLELEADKFSGFVLYNLGATLEEALVAIRTLVGEQGSTTHPGRSARVAAITNGWIQASEIKPTKTQEANETASRQPLAKENRSNNNNNNPPTNNSITSPPSRGTYWRHDGVQKEFALYVDGKSIAQRCKRSYSGDDYLVYDPEQRITYLLEDFTKYDENTYHEGRVLGSGNSIFWRHNGAEKVYALYVNGELISSRCKASYSNNDYIVYDSQQRITYQLESFKQLTDNNLRKGRILGSGPSRFWRHDGVNNVYALYIDGETIASRCNAAYTGDDYIVYDPNTQITYLLKSFATRKDNQLRNDMRVLGSGPSIYWRHNGTENTFALYVNGERISSRTENTYSGEDYICYDHDTGIRYHLEGFRNKKDNQLRTGRTLQ